MSRVALIVFDNIGSRLAGSAIRALELARALAESGHQPMVLTPVLEPDAGVYPFPVRRFDLALLRDAESIVLPPDALARVPPLARFRVPLVFDLYDPSIYSNCSHPARAIAKSGVTALSSITLCAAVIFSCAPLSGSAICGSGLWPRTVALSLRLTAMRTSAT